MIQLSDRLNRTECFRNLLSLRQSVFNHASATNIDVKIFSQIICYSSEKYKNMVKKAYL